MQLMQDIGFFQSAALVAVFGYVFCEILTEEGGIFEFWGDFVSWVATKSRYLANPLGYCSKCFTGQVAVWYSVYLYWGENWIKAAISEAIFAALAIFFVTVIKKLINR